MPQVPGLVPDVNPSMEGTPNVSVPVPVDAFGGAVGQAVATMGHDISHDSDQIWQRAVDIQNLNNETAAKDADAQYMIQSGKLHADFLNKEGTNAGPEALAQHIQDLQKLRTDLRAGLNPMAARMYDASSLSFMGRNIFNAAGHSGQQMKVAANNASTARIQIAQTNMGNDPTDEVGVQRASRVIQSEVEAQGRQNGWSQDQIDSTKQMQVSTGIAHQIVGMSRTNAIGAQRALDAARKNNLITASDADKVQATVQTQFRDQGSRVIADKILSDRRAGEDGEDEKTEDDYVQEGLAEADKYNSDDPLFKDYVRDRIITQYKKQKMIERDTDDQNVTTVGKALMKANSEGMSPTTIEELKAIDPAVSSAWDSLGRRPQVQKQILNQLQRNASGASRIPITPDNLQQFHMWKGIALSGDDDARAGFMSHNFATEPKMAVSQKNALMNLQDQMRKQAQNDPRVARAEHILGPQLQSAGLHDSNNKQDLWTFRGALADELEQFQTDHPGRLPSTDEVKTIGSRLLQEQATGRPGWFNTANIGLGDVGTQEQETFYKIKAPDELFEKIKADPAWARKGIIPNRDMIDRQYRSELWRRLYGGKAPEDKTNFPPNAPTRAPQ